MGGFRNAQNNKLQRKMWATQATYKQPASATEIDAYMGKENSCDIFTIITAGNVVKSCRILSYKPASCWMHFLTGSVFAVLTGKVELYHLGLCNHKLNIVRNDTQIYWKCFNATLHNICSTFLRLGVKQCGWKCHFTMHMFFILRNTAYTYVSLWNMQTILKITQGSEIF